MRTRIDHNRTALPIVAALCLAAIIVLGLTHARRVPALAGDDRGWLEQSAAGPHAIWTEPSLYHNYRPVFSSSLLLMQSIGADTPGGLALGRLLLFLAAAALTYWALTPILPSGAALVAAAVVGLHPARQQHLFWSSAAADAICLCLSILCLGIAVRAYRRTSAPWIHGLAVAALSALAVLSKEIGAALPVLVLAVPYAVSWRRRLALAGASAVGAMLALPGLVGAGQPGAILAAAGSSKLLTYPVRLFWPGDQESWFNRAAVHGDFVPIVTVGLLAIAAATLLVLAWRGRYFSAWAGSGALLVALGLLPWLIRHEDRGIGLGVVGIGMLIAGAAFPREGSSSNRAALVLLVLAVAWTPLWLRWDARWIEASRLSEAVISSGQSWREEVGAGPLLVALGAPARVGWHGEVAGIQEIDSCAIDILGQVGPRPVLPVEVMPLEHGSRLRIAAGGEAVLRWGGVPDPVLGVMRIESDDAGRARGAIFDPGPLAEIAARRGCRGVDVRLWDGERFSPPPSGGVP
jgi:hypothetical protein